jgi:hypothetical protein
MSPKSSLSVFFSKYQLRIDSDFDKIRSKRIPFHVDENSNDGPFQINFDVDKIFDNAHKFDLFSSIMTYSNIRNSPQLITEFRFLQFPEYIDSFFVFGTSSNGYDYATSSQNGKVSILDSDLKTFYFNAADSEISFIRILTELINFENIFEISNGDIPFEKIEEIRKKCIAFAGGPEYEKLYRHILISEKNNPGSPFEL